MTTTSFKNCFLLIATLISTNVNAQAFAASYRLDGETNSTGQDDPLRADIREHVVRWNYAIDELGITNRIQLFLMSTNKLDLGETSAGLVTASTSVDIRAEGYGDLVINAPEGFQVSDNAASFSQSITIAAAVAEAGIKIYVRFAPLTKQLAYTASLHFTGNSLDTTYLLLLGSSYPEAETLDVGTYNLSFFGSSPTNLASPEKIKLQVNNIAAIMQKLNLDVIGVEEISNDVSFDSLVLRVPHRKGVLSTRWSYSYNSTDPNFPPQKTGFIYDTTTIKLVDVRNMFVSLFDSARSGHPEKLPNYPGAASGFWAGGRLPLLATFDVSINGVSRRIKIVVIHAKSSSDAASYNRRVYDVSVLYDSLQARYSNDNVIIVGDYNDKLVGSTYAAGTSPYKKFVDNLSDYSPLTLPLETAGSISFIGGTAVIDHIIVSKTLAVDNIDGSTTVEDPRNYISGYNATTASDHLPVFTHFSFTANLSVTFLFFNASRESKQVLINWATVNEVNNRSYAIERSADNRNYVGLGEVRGAGNTNFQHTYHFADSSPLSIKSYYRLKQTDVDGSISYSATAMVNYVESNNSKPVIFPNPVHTSLWLKGLPGNNKYYACLINGGGIIVCRAYGNQAEISYQLSLKLRFFSSGIYNLMLTNKQEKHTLTIFKN